MRPPAPRRFGSTDLVVSPVGLGCARIGGVFQTDPAAFPDLLEAAFDAGVRFFDTADMYTQGESERLLGRVFARRRDSVVIASKAGYTLPAQRLLAARIKPLLRPLIRALGITRASLPAAVRGGPPSQDFSASHLRKAVEASLRRLQTDHLDLFQLHSPPLSVIERAEWLPLLEALKSEGKIRWFGVACDHVEDALAAVKIPGVASVQVTVNLLEQRALKELLPLAQQKGIAVIARECLANGLLVKDEAQIDLKTYISSPEEEPKRRAQLAALRAEAAEKKVPLAKLALEFVQQQEAVSTLLIGARTRAQLEGALAQLP